MGPDVENLKCSGTRVRNHIPTIPEINELIEVTCNMLIEKDWHKLTSKEILVYDVLHKNGYLCVDNGFIKCASKD